MQARYAERTGLRLLDRLPESQVFTADEAARVGSALGLSRAHVLTLLHELARARWVVRLKRGFYARADRQTGLPRAHPFTVGTALVQPSAVSHWSALSHWGLTEQLPRLVTLSSPRLTSRRARKAGAASSTTRSVGDQSYRYVFVRERHFFGLRQEWVSGSERVLLFDPERALLDAFRHFHVFGSLGPGLEVLEDHLDELDLDRLVSHTRRLGVASVAQRLGWALEQLHVAPSMLEEFGKLIGTADVLLDPTRRARGSRHSRWHVIANVKSLA